MSEHAVNDRPVTLDEVRRGYHARRGCLLRKLDDARSAKEGEAMRAEIAALDREYQELLAEYE